MAITNYSELQTAVANWTHRSDLTSQIPDFITLAEIRLARDLRISPLLTTAASGSIAVNGSSIALPSGFLSMVSVKITSSGAELKYITPDTYDRAQYNANGGTTPIYYTIIGATLFVSPTWSAGGTLTWSYFKKETALSGSNITNWYITNAPDMLLYACLLEAAPYMKSDVDTAMWKAYYENARDRLNDQYGVLDAYQRMLQMNQGKGDALTPAL